jgi:hypothetical protein
MLSVTRTNLVRPFGAWAPALTLQEFKARTPRPSDFKIKWMFDQRKEVYYSPEAMAHFKDPQQYKDAVDTARAMQYTDRFFGHGMKYPRHMHAKIFGMFAITFGTASLVASYFYSTYLPQNNPSWRKIVNKEWEEAINNSPWDHRSHVWAYCDVYAASIGDICLPGQRKFYIPA